MRCSSTTPSSSRLHATPLLARHSKSGLLNCGPQANPGFQSTIFATGVARDDSGSVDRLKAIPLRRGRVPLHLIMPNSCTGSNCDSAARRHHWATATARRPESFEKTSTRSGRRLPSDAWCAAAWSENMSPGQRVVEAREVRRKSPAKTTW